MADISQIQSDITALQNAQGAVVSELKQLADMVASLQAGAVTQEQLDELHDDLASVTSGLVAATQAPQAAAGQPRPMPVGQARSHPGP